MTVSKYVDVWCDSCGNWEQEATDVTAARVRKKARKLGWLVSLPGGQDLCPNCKSRSPEGGHDERLR